ncbi:MAG: hypothetical protein RIK87_00940 [Fuerstiella sp.]
MSVRTLPQPTPPAARTPAAMDRLRTPAGGSGAAADVPDSGFSAPRMVGLLVLSLIPFWAIPVAHLASEPTTATGFFQYELPYYVANGRAAFERGNGVLYPNPYDPSPDAPAIYVHWLPWMLGLLTAQAGADPGDVMLTLTFFASLFFAWATWQLVRLRIPSGRGRPLAFLAAMWGGGLLSAAGIAANLLSSVTWTDSILQFDPGQGMWFLNWGRNALFPTEAIYHAIVALCWVAEIRRRRMSANIWLVLLATTHPWSGLELLLTINLWRGVEFLRARYDKAEQSSLLIDSTDQRQTPSPDAADKLSPESENIRTVTRNQLSMSIFLLAAFLGYYKIWLPLFPQHAALQQVWELDWHLTWTSAALAYLPVLLPCVLWLTNRGRSSPVADSGITDDQPEAATEQQTPSEADRSTRRFLVCALCVAAGLAFHDRIISPVQPLHFTRGYVWMPLFLLGLPKLMTWWQIARQGSVLPMATAVLAVALLFADNLLFAAVHCQRQFAGQDGFHLDVHERALLATLHHTPATQGTTVLTDSQTVNYLLPTYAHVRPWIGHHFNTPDYPQRHDTWQRCFPSNRVDLSAVPDDIDLLVLQRSRDASALQTDPAWDVLPLKNGQWLAWIRTAGTTRR